MTVPAKLIARHVTAIYHFGRMQMPPISVAPGVLDRHLHRTYELFGAKSERDVSWEEYLEALYALDWFLAVACLERNESAWHYLYAARAHRSDCLLEDALRARAVKLYPRDQERQEAAVSEFWSQLLVSESEGPKPVLERYDGQRPLIPWLIRVFQNWHVSQLRQRSRQQPLSDDDWAMPLPHESDSSGRWHDAFRSAARECLAQLSDQDLLILGLRMRYRRSQRQVANLLGVHEGTISRQTEKLRDRCLEYIGRQLLEQGWTGEGLEEYVRTEMESVLLDEPRLSAARLAKLMAARGKSLSSAPPADSA
jgi:RNA polymerase sigma factor (sigma-70 family)